MKKIILRNTYFILALILTTLTTSRAQTITTSSEPIIVNQEVTFTADVTGNAQLEGLTEAWAWVWVPNTDFGAPTNVNPATSAQAAAKWTKKSGNIWEISFIPTEFIDAQPDEITSIGIIFKGADWGDGQTSDFTFEAAQDGALTVSVTNPEDGEIVDQYTTTQVALTTNMNSNIVLKANGNTVQTVTDGTSLTYNYYAGSSGVVDFEIIATADDQTVTRSLRLVIRPSSIQEAARPAEATQLGVNYGATSVTLVLQDPAKKKEFVYVIGDFNDWTPTSSSLMKVDKQDDANYWWITLDNLDPDTEYIYQYLINGSLIIADPYTEKVSDPDDQYIDDTRYPGLIDYPTGKTRFRASTFKINEEEYIWKTSDFTPTPIEDAVVYELLFRDFTEEATYEAAIAELDYIKNLGANVIHVMPVNEFEGNLSWGYNPNFYFAPDKYYGPKNKFKEFVDEAHARGLSVIIDLVLNHSYHSSPMVRMYNKGGDYDDPSADNPWFNETSNFTNPGLQWGADFNHESSYTKALVDSVNAHWMKYYHIDGYRFDFTKGFGNNPKTDGDEWGSAYDQDRIDLLLRMNTEIKKRNPNALVIFEHLADNSEEKVLAQAGISMWGNINHNFRDIVKGNNSDIAWQSPKERDMPVHGVMSYMESHDEERLIYDSETSGKVSQTYDLKKIENGIGRAKLASALFFLVPGPKLIWQFGERGYNVSINQSEYQGEVSDGNRTSEKPLIKEFDTQNDEVRDELYKVYAALLKLRNDYDLGSLADDKYSYDLRSDIKTISLEGATMKVKVVGNFTLNEEDYTYDYSSDDTNWYSYFENGESVPASGTMTLNPSEFVVLTNVQVTTPEAGLATGYQRIFEVTPYGFREQDEIKVYFNPEGTGKTFDGTVTLEAGLVMDEYGSGNITNVQTTPMTKEGNKYVATFTPKELFGLSDTDKPFEMSLKAVSGDVSEGPHFVSFEQNNAKLYLVGDVAGIAWDPSKSLEMTKDGEGGFYLDNINVVINQSFKFIDQQDWNGGQWGDAGDGKLQPASGEGGDIVVPQSGACIIRANINNLTYSISYDITSIEDNELSKSVIASPNPTSSEVTLTSTSLKGDVEWIVRDQSGRVLQLGTQLQVNGQFKKDLSMFPAGIYFVELFTSEGRVVKKVIRR
ncbi:T9SS type A sorting domain-containing protein [Flammeovirga yaeyamensis]|uniref:T9SS type A sorting domain-containing protein n=1 Tax=Flammeovirga yaeyamensis TaxID=367791 RepID=A0AAX1MZ46_9BACT|nr:alpha-amylase family glycosyl hydrolase [Flammeovirga yaeyamensis]MBB3700838.1 1,4-alpha-glucan branching enzyme [Flammeovirga yaeyamensis]NMF37946.1 T9SS type A sorting domain-containing protein [Flammeovirga yaeyamensis]QWG00598.1 T9SS type A sorting domain-containing protein [Flammeovirga yaeyamensis]